MKEIAGIAGRWYARLEPDLWSLLLIALLLFLLFGGSRIGAAGRGLGEAVRHVKRAITDADSRASDPKAAAPTMTELPVSKEPKLLPAKGESSASDEADPS